MLLILKELLNLLPNFNYIKEVFSDKLNGSIIIIECFGVLEKVQICKDDLNDNNAEKQKQLLKKTLFLCTALKEKLYETINIGHWSKVNLIYRRAFTLITYLEIIFRLLTTDTEILTKNKYEFCDKLLYDLDYGLLMGCPLDHDYQHLLSKSIDIITNELLKMKTIEKLAQTTAPPPPPEPTNNQLKLLNIKRTQNELCEIPKLIQPPILEFHEKYFLNKKPCLLLNCIDHWPAMEKWKQFNYLANKAGERLVPIEVGSRYTTEDWSQELIKFKDFFNRQINENINKIDGDGVGNGEGDGNDKPDKRIEYLAQHNLFDQIPMLKNDICIPEYCCCCSEGGSEDDSTTKLADVDIKAWLGPKGTISPMHFDPKHNLLCQIFGHKLIILASPNDTNNLYPFPGSLLLNTSQIDAEHLDLHTFPLVKNVQFYQFHLYSGEMVYIPPGWWHYIRSLDKSFSVSFWWN